MNGAIVDKLRYTIGLDTRGMDKGAKQTEGVLKKVGASIMRFKGIIVGAAGAMAARMAIGMAKMAGEVEGLEKAFGRLARSFGADASAILADLKRMAQGTMSTAELIRNANQAMLLGIPAEKLAKMMEIAMAAAKVTGQSVKFMYESIALGIGRQSRMILDNLGIIVKQEEIYRKASARLGRELTDTEKKQAFLNATMVAGERIIANAGGSGLTAAQRIQKLSAAFGNVKVAMGGLLASPIAAVFEKLAKWIGVASDKLTEMAKTNLQRTIDQLKEMGAESKEIARLLAYQTQIEAGKEQLAIMREMGKLTEDISAKEEQAIERAAISETGRIGLEQELIRMRTERMEQTIKLGKANADLARASGWIEEQTAKLEKSRAEAKIDDLQKTETAITNIIERQEDYLATVEQLQTAEQILKQIRAGTWKPPPSRVPSPDVPTGETEAQKKAFKEILRLEKQARDEWLRAQAAFQDAAEALMLDRFERERLEIERLSEDYERKGVQAVEIAGKEVSIAEWKAAALADIEKRRTEETDRQAEERRESEQDTARFLVDIGEKTLDHYRGVLKKQLAELKAAGKDQRKEYKQIQAKLRDIAADPITQNIRLFFEGDVSEVKGAADLAKVSFGALARELGKTSEGAEDFLGTLESVIRGLGPSGTNVAGAMAAFAVSFMDDIVGAFSSIGDSAKDVAEQQWEAARNARTAAEAILDFTKNLTGFTLAQQKETLALYKTMLARIQEILVPIAGGSYRIPIEDQEEFNRLIKGIEELFGGLKYGSEAFYEAVGNLEQSIETFGAIQPSGYGEALEQIDHMVAMQDLTNDQLLKMLMELRNIATIQTNQFGYSKDDWMRIPWIKALAEAGDMTGEEIAQMIYGGMTSSEIRALDLRIKRLTEGIVGEGEIVTTGSRAYQATTRITETQSNVMISVLETISAHLRGGIFEKLSGIYDESIRTNRLLSGDGILARRVFPKFPDGIEPEVPEVPVIVSFLEAIEATLRGGISEKLSGILHENVLQTSLLSGGAFSVSIPVVPVSSGDYHRIVIERIIVDGNIDPALAEQLGRDIGTGIDQKLRARGLPI